MTATPLLNCPDCGAPLPADSPQALCPACLMRQALASRTIIDGGKHNPSPPPSPEEIADKFPGFEILECLGRGGMGVVYKARQKSLNRVVAIKILAPERESESRFAERFAREAEMLAKLNHPHIVTIHDFGETGGLFYLMMEFVDGVNLRDLLRDGKLEPKQALAIVPPICEALQYAHDKGIVHRDIKPENLLLDRDGRIKIADFGIAALMGADGDASGTPPYMAPEQSGTSSEVDSRADIYALGVVLYEMLTGERPNKNLVAPSRKVSIDVRLDEMVLRALEKEPERRYQTAGEFRTVVETMVSMRDLPSSKPAADAGSTPKGKWVAALLTVASLLAGLSAVLHHQKDQAGTASGEVNASKRMIEPPPGADGSKPRSDSSPGSPQKPVRLTPEEFRKAPSDQIIRQGLRNPNSAWSEWQEIEARAGNGTLPSADADGLFEGAIDWLRRDYPDGYPDKEVLYMSGVLDELRERRLVSEQRLLNFLQAFYRKPWIVPLQRIREGGTVKMDITLHQEYYRQLLGHKLLNEVRSITVDGQPVPVQQLYGHSGHSANMEDHRVELQVAGLAPGRHVVKCEMDSALVTVPESAKLDQQAPPELWPPAKRRWQRTCEAELWVYAKDAEIVGLSDDPALNPVNSRGLTVKPIVIRMRDGKRVAAVTFDHKVKTKVPYSVSVTLKLAGKSYPCGRFCSDGNDYSDSEGKSESAFIAMLGDLDPQVGEAEVVLAPDPRFIEPSPRVDKIWGKDIVFSGIPLNRLDAAPLQPAPDAKTGGKRPIFLSDLQKMPTDQVIRVGIENPDESSPWDVLIERMNNGQFGATEADALMEALTGWLRKDHPDGYGEQRISFMKLIKELHQRHLIIERRTMDYLQALNGNGGVDSLPRVRQGATVQLNCNTDTPFIWNDEWLGLALLREVESITVDGQPVELQGITKSLFSPPQFSGELMVGDLAPGKHIVRCEIFSALVPVADVAGLGSRAPRAEWPAIKHSWKASFDVDLDVFPKDATLVGLSDDPALNPLETGAMKVQSIVIERRNKSWVAVVSFEDDPKRGIPFSVDVTLKLAGKTYDCGSYCSSGHGGKAYYLLKNDGYPFIVGIEPLDPQVTEAELLLTPAPENLESNPQVDRIWGKDIVVGHVPLKRSDLVESK